jgi:hypothetical protein
MPRLRRRRRSTRHAMNDRNTAGLISGAMSNAQQDQPHAS